MRMLRTFDKTWRAKLLIRFVFFEPDVVLCSVPVIPLQYRRRTVSSGWATTVRFVKITEVERKEEFLQK